MVLLTLAAFHCIIIKHEKAHLDSDISSPVVVESEPDLRRGKVVALDTNYCVFCTWGTHFEQGCGASGVLQKMGK